MSDRTTDDRLRQIQETLERLQEDAADLHLKLDRIMRHLGINRASERQAWEAAWSQSLDQKLG